MDKQLTYHPKGHELLDKELVPVLAENVTALRKRTGLGKKALCQMVGIGRPLLNKIEKGTAIPRILVVARIADALNIPLEALLFADEETGPATDAARD